MKGGNLSQNFHHKKKLKQISSQRMILATIGAWTLASRQPRQKQQQQLQHKRNNPLLHYPIFR